MAMQQQALETAKQIAQPHQAPPSAVPDLVEVTKAEAAKMTATAALMTAIVEFTKAGLEACKPHEQAEQSLIYH